MNRIDYQQKIIKALTWLKTQVQHNNSLSLTDINHGAEHFYCGLLNIVYGYNLSNINISDQNTAAIDLGDEENKIAIQVTSTSSLRKTKYTVNKFLEKKLYKKYERLVILNIVKKAKHTVPNIGSDDYSFDTEKDILDVGDLIKVITNNPDVNHLKEVVDFLDEELLLPSQRSLPNEVLTVLGLIEYISDQDHTAAGTGYLEQPIPEEKIYKRFADHSAFLVDKYNTGFIEYGAVLDAVRSEVDFGQVKLRRAANYLRVYSDSILNDCGGNPKAALQKIVDQFSSLLGNHGYKFDAGAAEFYIIEQLMKCNIFPNKELTHE